MARGMPEQQQSGGDNSLDLLWMLALLIGAILLGWYFGKIYITSAVFYVRFYEIIAINYVFGIYAKIIQFAGFSLPQISLNEWSNFIKSNWGSGVDFPILVKLSTAVGNYARYPLTLLLLGGAASLHFGGVSHKLRNVFDTKRLKETEQDNWPQIKPVVKLDLVKQNLDEGPWAMALSPMKFCEKHELLDVQHIDGKYVVNLHRGAAYRVLSLQLGPRWGGINTLPIHTKAIFAIFAARVDGNKKEAEHLLDHIANSAVDGKPNFSGAEALLQKHSNSKKVANIVSAHGYITSVFASMLVGARESGVLATSEFIWLKPIDRRLWYMLNSVGRPTAVSEISGAFAHWLAEKRLGLPLMVPMVEEAVRGLELAISEMIYKPKENE